MTTSSHPADRLSYAIDRVDAPLCVGIDPVQDKLPSELQGMKQIEGIGEFCKGIIEAVASIAAAVKFQSACFERLGSKGIALLGDLRQLASDSELQIVLDAKRGDIGISAEHYAAAATADGPCDWITVNPYLGIDGIVPFLDAGLGVFCLVRTSNPSGDEVQKQLLHDCRTVSDSIADLLAITGSNYIGNLGMSSLGAVVGATKTEELIGLRDRMPRQIFLMPGIGAQGATPSSVECCFGDGYGALVTASRSVIYPESNKDWQSDIYEAATKLAGELKVVENE